MKTTLSGRVRRYIWLSVLLALAIAGLAGAVDRHPSVATPWLAYTILIAIGWAGEEYRVPTRLGAYYTLTAAIHLPFMLLLTPLEAISVSAISIVCSQLRRRRSLYIIAYNAVVRVVSLGIPTLLLALWRLHDARFSGARTFLSANLLRGIVQRPGAVSPLHLDVSAYVLLSGEILAGCILAAAVYYALDSMLIATVVALRAGVNPITGWKASFKSTALPEITRSALGIIAACVAVVNPILVLFVCLPVAMTHMTAKMILRLERETIEAVTTLADTIDFRDIYTAQHSVRVAEISRQLARRLGLSAEQVDEITLAARVHDLGKIGISNDILLKDGKLTAEEMAVMQTHPRLGVDILRKYHNFRGSLPIVLHHHERYDGKGYPDGLAGDEIPLGAQIVAHADAYDAMTSDRPYRRGMRPEVAVQRVGEASGTQFNPAVAGAFVAMMREKLAASGQTLPETGGSLAERHKPPAEPERLAAGAEDKMRYFPPGGRRP